MRSLIAILCLAGVAPVFCQPSRHITSVDPNSGFINTQTAIRVIGSGFAQGDHIRFRAPGFEPVRLTTTYVSSTELRATIPANFMSAAGQGSVFVGYMGFSETCYTGCSTNQLPFTIAAIQLQLTRIDPNSAPAGSPTIPLNATGAGFAQGTYLVWRRNNVDTRLATNRVTSEALTATIPASLLTAEGEAGIFAVIPGCDDTLSAFAPSGSFSGVNPRRSICATSNALPFRIESALRITRLTPDNAPTRAATGANQEFLITGTGFIRDVTRVRWRRGQQTIEIGHRWTSATEMVGIVPATQLTEPGVFQVSVGNPGVGNAPNVISNELDFTVTGRFELTGIEPPSLPAGSPTRTIAVIGSGLSNAIRVRLTAAGGSPFTPSGQQFAAGRINVPIDASRLAQPVRYSVEAFDTANPSRISNSLPFEVVASAATITDLSPQNIRAGSAGFPLTISGTGFLANSRVLFGARELTPASLAANSISVNIPAEEIATPRIVAVKVRLPNGVESNGVNFTIDPAMRIASLSPPSVSAGSPAFELTINGSGFPPNPRVRFGGVTLDPASSLPNRVTVNVPASAVAAAGRIAVRVTSPSGDSDPFDFTVSAGVTLLSLNPPSRQAGQGAFVLTLNGSNMLPNPAVRFDGTPVAVTVATAGAVTVNVPANLTATAGPKSVAITVAGVTASLSFAVTMPPVTPNLSAAQLSVNATGTTRAAVGLSSPAPAAIAGMLQLGFEPDASAITGAYIDPGIAFRAGGRTLGFSIAAGQTTATLQGNGDFNVGATAGRVVLRVASLTVGGQPGNALPQPVRVTVPRARPAINSVRLEDSAGGVTVQVIGYASTRDLVSAIMTFTIAAQTDVGGSTSFTVPVQTDAQQYFGGEGLTAGSAFRLRIPFPVEGDKNRITGVSVSLSNAEGTSPAVQGGR